MNSSIGSQLGLDNNGWILKKGNHLLASFREILRKAS